MPNTYYSDQITKLNNQLTGQHDELKPSDFYGRLRVATFHYKTPTTGLEIGDTVQLCKLPKGACVMGGAITWEAMGTSATIQLGVTGTLGKYLGSTSVASAGGTDIANTIALNAGRFVVDEETVLMTIGGASVNSVKQFKGAFLIVVD